MKLNIASLNIHDDKINSKGGIDHKVDRVDIVAKLIESEDFHYVGTQEMTKKFEKRLKDKLKKYKFYGSYRVSNTNLINIPWNESNKIITNQNINYHKTHRLPWIPIKISEYKPSNLSSIMPRICTVAINKETSICMINTHLDYKIPSLQLRQLKKLTKIIKYYSETYKVILTGDFNMEPFDTNFSKFVNNMNELGIHKITINGHTFKDFKTNKKMKLDYIFIPKEWYVIEAGTIKNKEYNSITDHTGIYAKIKTR